MVKKGKKKKQAAAASTPEAAASEKSQQQEAPEQTSSEAWPGLSQTSQSKQQKKHVEQKVATQPQVPPQPQLQGAWSVRHQVAPQQQPMGPPQPQVPGAQGVPQPIPPQMQQQRMRPPQPPLPGAQDLPQPVPPQVQQQQMYPPQPQLQGPWGLRHQVPPQPIPPQMQQQRMRPPQPPLPGAQDLPQPVPPQVQQQQMYLPQPQLQGPWGLRHQVPPQPQPQVPGAEGVPQPIPLQMQQQRMHPPQPPVPGAQDVPQPIPPQPVRPPQSQVQRAWGLQQKIPPQQQQMGLPQHVAWQQQQTAWNLPQSQISQVSQQQQQRAQHQQQQQKASIDIGASGDHRQVPGGSGMQRQQPSSSTDLEVSQLGATAPFYSEESEMPKMTSAQLKVYHEMIPKRANPQQGGRNGRPTQVLTNMFKIIFNDKFVTNAVHYDIVIKPHKESTSREQRKEIPLPKAMCRSIFEQCREKNFKHRYPAFDGKKNAYSANDLPFGESFGTIVEHANKDGRKNKYIIEMRKVATVDLSWIKNFRPGFAANRDQAATQVLDIIMRHAPELRFINIGRSIFWDNQNNWPPLSDGVCLARGGFMSGVIGWKPYLNVDVSHKGFVKSQKVLSYLVEVLRIDERRITYEDVMEEWTLATINSFLKGLKVSYEIPNVSKRTHRIIQLSHKTCNSTFNQGDRETGQFKTLTIKDYFLKEKRYKIQRPDLPAVHVNTKSDGTEILLPIELCTIMPNQAVRKMNESQTSAMIKETATDAMTRKDRILHAFQQIRVNDNPVMTQEFHLSVSPEMEKVAARILSPPDLRYRDPDRPVEVRKGTWNLQQHFNEARHLEDDSWTIVNLCGKPIDPLMQTFSKTLQSTARDVGMNIGQPLTPFKSFRLNNLNDITKYFSQNSKLKLIVVIIPDGTDIMYGKVKKITEMEVGVLTQCLKFKTLRKLDSPRPQFATVKNILLKINSKLNGINHTFTKMPFCLNEPCMLVGADVTHPSPDSKNIPSVAAVAANNDKSAFRYNVALRLQQPKEEIIRDLKAIIQSQLAFYVRETNCVPKRIIYYRDGVSEGQLAQVMFHEIEKIKAAIKEFTHDGKKYKIEITCLVVQKRHHIRLFPVNPRDTYDRNSNVQVGTIVDTTITHPDHIDFYLVSHASIQGTARPTKYRCIYNESNFTEDQLEELTFYLCHIYARCARSVSYPAPTYYAHLGAYRGRALLQGGVSVNLNNLGHEQRQFVIKMNDIGSPMFFV